MAKTFHAFTIATISHCNGVRWSDCERAVGPQRANPSKIQVITAVTRRAKPGSHTIEEVKHVLPQRWPRPRLTNFAGKVHPGSTASRRSEEHTSELQSLRHLVCRLLLE